MSEDRPKHAQKIMVSLEPKTMNVATAVLSFAELLGSDTAFCLTGGMAMHLNRALYESQSLRTVFVHHETAAVAAAEGYSKSWELRRPGLALITSGPAVTNSLTGLASAYGDSTPLILIAGQVKTADINYLNVRTHGIQEVDQLGLVSHVTKFAARISADNAHEVLAEAYDNLTSGRLGPVFLEVPLDEQLRACERFELPTAGKAAHSAQLESNLALDSFQRPVVLIGNGVRRRSARVRALVSELADRNVPRLYTWLSFDLEPAATVGNQGCPGMLAPIHANRTLALADLVVTLGARLDLATTAYDPERFGAQARRIIVDIDMLELMKFRPDANTTLIAADGVDILEELLDSGLRGSREWYGHCLGMRNDSLLEEEVRLKSDSLTVRAVARLASEHSANRVIVAASSGLAEETLTRFFAPESRTLFFNGAALGSMGVGLAHGLGAAAGNPRDGVWIFEGDGGLLMNIQELSSLRLNHPTGVGLFLMNNRGYASIGASQSRGYQYEFGASERSGLAFPNWKQLAESFDLLYMPVHTTSELRDVLVNWNRKDRTCLYDLLIPDQEARGPQLVTKMVDGIPMTQSLEELAWPEH